MALEEEANTDNNSENIKDINNAAFLIKKTEKLTAALYKVTELVPDDEPLKWELRGISIDLLMETMCFMNGAGTVSRSVFNSILLKISKLSALLEVSYMGSIVSQMNFSILRDEYISLRDILLSIEKRRHLPLKLSVHKEELDSVKESHAEAFSGDKLIKDIYKGHIDKSDNMSNKNPVKVFAEKNKGQLLPTQIKRTTKEAPKTRRNAEEREKRRQMIVDIIKVNGEVNIKDILLVPLVSKRYSEKTIQRELIDMVNNGVIKKKGERRWSKYYL